ncbi:hypothetical protein HY312_04615 [Candidatus Saccharibacteria bacterium]|nr:hypothetical protein [Candidatus Saccharibacteria bacterium]
MKLIRNTLITVGLAATVFTGTAGLALSQSTSAYAGTCKGAAIVAIPPWYDNLCGSDGKTLQSPKEFANTGGQDKTGIGKYLTIIAMNIVTILLYVTGYVSLAFIIWGGFKYIISGDSSNGTSAAKTTILNAIIGLIISIMAIAIVKFIAGAIV